MKREDRIERLMKDWEPAIKAAFLDAVKTLRDRVNLPRSGSLTKGGRR
jgi:hypothetical protein